MTLKMIRNSRTPWILQARFLLPVRIRLPEVASHLINDRFSMLLLVDMPSAVPNARGAAPDRRTKVANTASSGLRHRQADLFTKILSPAQTFYGPPRMMKQTRPDEGIAFEYSNSRTPAVANGTAKRCTQR